MSMSNSGTGTSLPDIPTRAQFTRAAAKATLVAMAVPIPFDHETAVTLADRFLDEEHLMLLESATSGPSARYSFLAFDPLWVYDCADAAKEHPIKAVRARLVSEKLKTVYAEGVRLGGPDVAAMVGALGFFGYGTARAIEPSVGKAPPKALALPDALFFLPASFFVLDHLARRLFVCALARVDAQDRDELDRVYDEKVAKLLALIARLKVPHLPPPPKFDDKPVDFARCDGTFTKERFLAAAERCLEEIKAGEIFQIQIGNRLSVPTSARPFDIFRHLRTLNPSPYMFFFKFGARHILGASPEMMVGVSGPLITHRPIAGTRRRTWDPEKDLAMKKELTTSEKERAEHVMLVDLGRNDIGRVAAPGTVTVEELMTVEEYSHVFHMVSQVTGRLRSDADAFDAMTVSFPNGTVCGAPKIRAMQLINELEPVAREFYAGSLGLFDLSGNLRSTILIRSLYVADGVASTQASAGIVYDSIPDQEWLETRNKMAACVIAMQNTH